MTEVRLQKYLANCGVASRRKCEAYIEAGKISVNGEPVCQLGVKITPGKDRVEFEGKEVCLDEKRLLLFHKPFGVVTTMNDPQGRKTVAEYVRKFDERFYPVGRLDFDTTGLLLLTTDGELANYLTHPRYKVEKKYEALVQGECTEETARAIKKGVGLEDGIVKGKLKILRREKNGTRVSLSIHIGKNRVVRRLFDALGMPVLTLKRLEHGPYKLGNLKEGEIKEVVLV